MMSIASFAKTVVQGSTGSFRDLDPPGLPKYLEPDPVELGITLPVVPVELVKSVPFGIL